MRIALFGYGRMGKMIEGIALERGHTIAVRVDKEPEDIDFKTFDVAIDFSTPESAFENITTCLKHGKPVVSGTTGWLDKYEEAVALTHDKNGSFIYASNFSLGVNLFFALNEHLARMVADQSQYKALVEETHHIHKLDAPSGTAITLADGIVKSGKYTGWKLGESDNNTLSVRSYREGEVPGTHTITYQSDVDEIRITHEAKSRKGFAEGAVIAAEWILDKQGVFSMKDVLNLS